MQAKFVCHYCDHKFRAYISDQHYYQYAATTSRDIRCPVCKSRQRDENLETKPEAKDVFGYNWRPKTES